MRTTVDIPEALHKRLKFKAAREGTTIKALVLRGVEQTLAEPAKRGRKVKFPLVRSKHPGTLKITNQQINEILFP